MRVLVTGGTGSIGSAIVQVLLHRGHKVLALGRSAASCETLAGFGAEAVAGDLHAPANWISAVDSVECVIHTASTWEVDMGVTDRLVVAALLDRLQQSDTPRGFIYTGGCWLYGASGDVVVTEASPLDAPPQFSWAIPVLQTVLRASRVRGMVIHPAMVYERDGGVFRQMCEDAAALGYVRVVGSEAVRWPLVQRVDLAELYALLLEQGLRGDVYNGAAIEGVTVGVIARAIAGRLGASPEPRVCNGEAAISAYGDLADGYALDQQMSGQKAMEKLCWRPRHRDVLADIA